MIHIVRYAAPSDLAVYVVKNVRLPNGKKVSRAEREVIRANSFFGNSKNFKKDKKVTKAKFEFDVYSDRALRKALEALFRGKCAYCESLHLHVSPSDIEHFRPKSEIDTGKGILQPGYFWLASDWNNLLVSCPDCNRKRLHEVPGQPKEMQLGKLTQFPLTDERFRVRRGEVAAEEEARLLLDPCVDHPEEHLRFDDDGLVHPRKTKKGLSAKGSASITVLALQRKPLVEERLKVLTQFKLHVRNLSAFLKARNELETLKASAPARAAVETQIAEVRSAMEKMLRPDAVYLAMLRGWIRDTNRRGDLDLLRQFKIDLTALLS